MGVIQYFIHRLALMIMDLYTFMYIYINALELTKKLCARFCNYIYTITFT